MYIDATAYDWVARRDRLRECACSGITAWEQVARRGRLRECTCWCHCLGAGRREGQTKRVYMLVSLPGSRSQGGAD